MKYLRSLHWLGVFVGLAMLMLSALTMVKPLQTLAASTASGPYVTLLFSRTEMNGAIDCKQNSSGIAPLDTEIAPYLKSLGMSATGTLVTSKVSDTARFCTHSNESLMASWSDAKMLASTYGWHFVSHTATYPANVGTISGQQAYDETCGSAKTIDAHGLPGGHGLIAYPGLQGSPTSLQTNYSAKCFAWGRQYGSLGITASSAATTSPFWQNTGAPNGGPCNDSAKSCYTISATGSKRYVLPANYVKRVNNLAAGQWLSIQAYVLVKGKNPAASPIQWDCTAADPTEHWTNDNERYCESDWKQIIAAIAARKDITVTDPLTVGIAFGRPATYAN